jgi:heptaprenylglyceryl phosphate synthase
LTKPADKSNARAIKESGGDTIVTGRKVLEKTGETVVLGIKNSRKKK